MVNIPPLRMIGGVFTTPMEAGPDDFVESVNLHNVNGVLQKRDGMVALSQYGKYTTSGLYCGWGDGTTEATAVATGSISPAAVDETTLYVGSDSPFFQFHIYGAASYVGVTWATVVARYKRLRDCVVQVYNGSAWATVLCADLDVMAPDASDPTKLHIGPWRPWDTSASGTVSFSAHQVRGLIEPPAWWSTKVIGGQTKYWLRVLSLADREWDKGTSDAVASSSTGVTLAENPILNLLYFNDRRGTAHEFVVVKYDDMLLKYYLDGAELTPSDGLQPDGASKMFAPTTKVWSYYDSSTDRIIGHVENLGWFYAISGGNGEIYSLAADPVATLTGYENVVGGLRSVIPPGVVACTHDDRIWTFDGTRVVYSAPGVYKDVWPNDNEVLVQDGEGNVTAAASIGGVLAIFKRNSIWVAQSDGSADGYTAYRLPGNIGCVAPRSVAVAGNHCWFLAEDGIYIFDGQTVTKKSARINGLLVKGVASSNMAAAIGVWFPLYSQYRLYYPGEDSLPWVCSAAIYCAVDGQGNCTFWPQGKKKAAHTALAERGGTSGNASTDYGFNATFVATDQTTDSNRVILGDRYGCIWEMDKGRYDATSPVTFYGLTHRLALGAGQKVLLRWITPSTKVLTNNSWALSAIMDGDTYNKQTLAMPGGGENPALAFHSASVLEAVATTYANSFEMQTTASGSVQGMGRFVQLELSDAVAQPWELEAVTLELNRFGRRG